MRCFNSCPMFRSPKRPFSNGDETVYQHHPIGSSWGSADIVTLCLSSSARDHAHSRELYIVVFPRRMEWLSCCRCCCRCTSAPFIAWSNLKLKVKLNAYTLERRTERVATTVVACSNVFAMRKYIRKLRCSRKRCMISAQLNIICNARRKWSVSPGAGDSRNFRFDHIIFTRCSPNRTCICICMFAISIRELNISQRVCAMFVCSVCFRTRRKLESNQQARKQACLRTFATETCTILERACGAGNMAANPHSSQKPPKPFCRGHRSSSSGSRNTHVGCSAQMQYLSTRSPVRQTRAALRTFVRFSFHTNFIW